MIPDQENIRMSLTNEDILKLCGVPKKYFHAKFRSHKGHESEKAKIVDAINANRSIFLCGDCGVGKTHLAVAALGYWIHRYKPITIHRCPLFVPAVEYYQDIRDSFDSKMTEKEILEKYFTPPLLVFDDLGKEKISDWSTQQLFTMMDKRYREEKPMIITTNLDLTTLANSVNDSIPSRIVEMGLVLTLTGEDYRLSMNSQNKNTDKVTI
jgi:DNA replication protein DnaC